MLSVVIAAHNEQSVIGRCLDALLAQEPVTQLDITVAANGCTDDTVAEARRRGVRVLEVEQANKAAALNAADAVAQGFPRIYLDADIAVPAHGCAAVAVAMRDPSVLAAVPRRRVETAGRPALVRAYFAINTRLPAFTDGLFGRGMITLSEQGRARFDHFPIMVADDLFLDSLFTPVEKRTLAGVEVVVEAPRRTADLLRRLVRVRRGNAAMRTAGRTGTLPVEVRHADRSAWLRTVVARQPTLAPAAVAYVVITGLAAVLARRRPRTGHDWGRDESTRQPDRPVPERP